MAGCAIAASAIAQQRDNQCRTIARSRGTAIFIARCSAGATRRGIAMLEFMVIAILLLTLMAVYAIRRAEQEIIDHDDLERRPRELPPSAQWEAKTRAGTKVGA
jgi:hypothetical protein